MRTQDLNVKTARELYRLDPDYVTVPEGAMPMKPIVFWSLFALRVYLIGLICLVVYRFALYAHMARP